MAALPPLHVLVVDDQADVRKSLSYLLKSWGHECRGAESGAEALRVAEDLCPDVVLLDIILPDAGGYEVARQLRRLPAPPVWVVALTGHLAPDVAQATLEVGFDHFFIKPVEAPTLWSLLSSYAQAGGSRGTWPRPGRDPETSGSSCGRAVPRVRPFPARSGE